MTPAVGTLRAISQCAALPILAPPCVMVRARLTQVDRLARFPLEAPARLDPVQISVDIELQQHRGMISRQAIRQRRNPV